VQVLRLEHVLGGARLRDPVRVEHQRVAGLQLGVGVLQLRVAHEPQERARDPDLLDLAGRTPQERRRVASACHGHADRRT
jgi:hypothetical protein